NGSRPGKPGSRQDGRRPRAGQKPAREPPEQLEHQVRDEERAGVRRRDARGSGSAAESVGEAVVGGRSGRGRGSGPAMTLACGNWELGTGNCSSFPVPVLAFKQSTNLTRAGDTRPSRGLPARRVAVVAQSRPAWQEGRAVRGGHREGGGAP